MSKAVSAITSVFGGGPPKLSSYDKYMMAQQNASRIGGARTPEQEAEQRAALAAQGRRPKEKELDGQETLFRPLQGSGGTSSFWT